MSSFQTEMKIAVLDCKKFSTIFRRVRNFCCRPFGALRTPTSFASCRELGYSAPDPGFSVAFGAAISRFLVAATFDGCRVLRPPVNENNRGAKKKSERHGGVGELLNCTCRKNVW